MAFEIVLRSSTVVFLLGVVASVNGQQVIPSARTILGLSGSEQVAFINETMDAGFPADRADQMTMLIINRSAITVPLIEARLEQVVLSDSSPKGFVDTATEMIAYAGDEHAVRALAKLLVIDEKRFGPQVGRTLTNAGNWRNPFSVAYVALSLEQDSLARPAVEWAESEVASNRMQRAWAEAMLDRLGRLPDESDWSKDPIASRLHNGTSSELRTKILALATDAQTRRNR